jgi:hypothetical protein
MRSLATTHEQQRGDRVDHDAMPATTMITTPSIGLGELSRCTASQASEPIATRSSSALMNAA